VGRQQRRLVGQRVNDGLITAHGLLLGSSEWIIRNMEYSRLSVLRSGRKLGVGQTTALVCNDIADKAEEFTS
jgi:hypothetical protein